MPIYEYEALHPDKGCCATCAHRFEVIHSAAREPLTRCPDCGREVVKLVSLCRAVIVECSADSGGVEKQIGAYEKEGMWSHAAELADKHSEKTRDGGMKLRAIDNYHKAGYDAKSLEEHAKTPPRTTETDK